MSPSRFLIGLAACILLIEDAHADGKVLGCWSNITSVSVDPNFSPTHEKTTSSGTIICFRKHGVITTTSIGGFEALGSSGRFVFASGHLTVSETEIADGWTFSHGKDHCIASFSSEQLLISGCKGWKKSRVMLLHKQNVPPELTGVAAGVFR
jgi:hypothetical protein